ncbi:uncharacterized protein LOC114261937 [Camellia sinensis]|uniref:uncharacterized protein LOC114261937 n=1 Tax=Camellia sinensis TaxID=4442 RepID=UPI0010362129|nr:uncharacterized protein LOC114261937 [Camellia sinensis]
MAVRQPPKNFRQSFVASKGLKKLLDLPVHKRKAPVLLNFIPSYKSTLPNVPKRKKKSLSPPSATNPLTISPSRTDQGSTSDPADQPSSSAPYLVPIAERKHRRRLVLTAEMGHPKPVTKDLLASIPSSVDEQPTQTLPPPKPKRIKKAQRKAKVAQVESEDTIPISKLAESDKSQPSVGKRHSESQPPESQQSKKSRSSSAITSGSKKPDAPWAPTITLEDKPVMASDRADDINVGVALSTALLLSGDLERNAQYSEYENYALMLQHSVQVNVFYLADIIDQGSTSDPADQPSSSAPHLVPIAERKRRRRFVLTAEMGHPKPVTKDLLASIPSSIDEQPTQTLPPPKPKRIKKAQPKAKVVQVESEDTLPISKLAESDKSQPSVGKRRSESQPPESQQSKKPRSSSAITSGSKKPDAPWAPTITLEDKPVMASDRADDINVDVALSTALLLPGDLKRNAQYSEHENYALMLQHSV